MASDAPPLVVEDFLGIVQPQRRLRHPRAMEGRRVRRDARPQAGASSEEGNNSKLPVLVYFHGGGYCVCAYDQPMYHSCCQRYTAELPALALSVQYRLAPEHRLLDAVAFLSWLRAQAELPDSADPIRTFVSGVSAGANRLFHHVVVRTASGRVALGPAVRLAGYVLLCGFFGSVERTATETEADVRGGGGGDRVSTSSGAWRCPPGTTRWPTRSVPTVPACICRRCSSWRPAGRDVLRGHVLRFAARLKAMGKAVELAEFEEEDHGFSVGWSDATRELVRILKRFVHHGAAVSGCSE
ncbi:hypothetical protein EJB05_15928, partial [Eragrostis curvula]